MNHSPKYDPQFFLIAADCNRLTSDWLLRLPACTLQKARVFMSKGGQLLVRLDELLTPDSPMWRAIILDADGQHWALCSPQTGAPRSLKSVQLVYQVARNLGLSDVAIPVESKSRSLASAGSETGARKPY